MTIREDCVAVFGTEAGQRVLGHLVQQTAFMRAPDVKDGFRRYDPEQAAYEAGKRDLIGYLLGMVGARLDLTPRPPQQDPKQKRDKGYE